MFADPNPTGRRVLHPKLFEHYPDAKESFCDFADANMKVLTGELMVEYVVDTLVPALRKEHNSANPQQPDVPDNKEFLLSMGYRNLGVATVVKWMNALGYRYDVRRKHYFNDRHEEPTNVTYREAYLERYWEYESRSHRWIKISKTESAQLIEKEIVLPGQGYKYVDEANKDMVEYHVDDGVDYEFHKRMTTDAVEFGGNLSVRRDPTSKPLIVFGQDECTFKQFLFMYKFWVG